MTTYGSVRDMKDMVTAIVTGRIKKMGPFLDKYLSTLRLTDCYAALEELGVPFTALPTLVHREGDELTKGTYQHHRIVRDRLREEIERAVMIEQVALRMSRVESTPVRLHYYCGMCHSHACEHSLTKQGK